MEMSAVIQATYNITGAIEFIIYVDLYRSIKITDIDQKYGSIKIFADLCRSMLDPHIYICIDTHRFPLIRKDLY